MHIGRTAAQAIIQHERRRRLTNRLVEVAIVYGEYCDGKICHPSAAPPHGLQWNRETKRRIGYYSIYVHTKPEPA